MIFGMVSLGCPKNQVDGEMIMAGLAARGWSLTSDPGRADVIVINTCGFIQSAKEESIEQIMDMARYKTEGGCRYLIATGCLAQRYPRELAEKIPELDGIVGIAACRRLPAIMDRIINGERVVETSPLSLREGYAPRLISTAFYSAYLKIADGCDNRCAYCIIPEIRGPFRSKPKEDVLHEASELAENGVKELILIAQDTSRYGMDLYGRPFLVDLLYELQQIKGLHWIRLLYLHPAHLDRRLIEAARDLPKIVKYLDLPLQHASGAILRSMNRPGSGESYLDMIKEIKEAVPGIFIRSTFIVGFPGETEEDFRILVSFLEKARLDRAGFFKFSREEGTPAYVMKPHVSLRVKERRFNEISALQRSISRELLRERVGREMEALITGYRKDGFVLGRTEGDAPGIDGLLYLADFPCSAGEFYRVKITGSTDYDLMGKALYKIEIKR
ncbi:MAG: 30S ribosomal protein S12 methylthiotransferase RimO [Bacillota bacterium]